MSTPIAANDKFTARICCQAGDQISINDFAWIATPVDPGATLENLAVSLRVLASADYLPALSSAASFYGISIKRTFPAPTQPVTSSLLTPGTGTGLIAPRQAAALVAKVTAVAGRKGSGRIYFPFLDAALISAAGHLTAPGVALLNTMAGDFLATLITTAGFGINVTMNPQLVSGNGITYTPITSFVVRTKIATQKRRGDYGRTNSLPW